MELIYTVNGLKKLQSDLLGDESPVCSLSLRNIIAFSSTFESDDIEINASHLLRGNKFNLHSKYVNQILR